MSGVAAFELAQPVALDSLGENYGRSAFVLHRGLVRVVNLARIVPAAMQAANLFVGHVLDEFRGLGIAAEKFLSYVGPAPRLERLIVAIHAFVHQLNQASGSVLLKEAVPIAAPNALDYVPTRTT